MGNQADSLEPDFFTATQVATMLGVHDVTVRRWRSWNAKLGVIKYGPPYEYRGSRVVYPNAAFREWCGQVTDDQGVTRINLPITATIPLPKKQEAQDELVVVGESEDGNA